MTTFVETEESKGGEEITFAVFRISLSMNDTDIAGIS